MSHRPLLAWGKQDPCQSNPNRLSRMSRLEPQQLLPTPPRTPLSLAGLTHHVEHGVVEAFVTGWCGGRRVLQSVPGPGPAQGRQPGEELGITIHIPPIPAAPPAETPCL